MGNASIYFLLAMLWTIIGNHYGFASGDIENVKNFFDLVGAIKLVGELINFYSGDS